MDFKMYRFVFCVCVFNLFYYFFYGRLCVLLVKSLAVRLTLCHVSLYIVLHILSK